MGFSVIHHHTIIRNQTSQVFELLATVCVAEQINQLQHGWWIQHAAIVTCIRHISKKHPSNWHVIHTNTYTHTWPVSCPGVSRGRWPPLSSTSCVPPTSPKRETLSWQQPSSLSFNHPPPLSFLSISSPSSHFNIPPPQLIPHFCNLRRYTGDVIYFEGYQKRGILKPLLISLTCRNSTYKPGEPHSVMWVGLTIRSDSIVNGKHHPYCALLSGLSRLRTWWGFLGVL